MARLIKGIEVTLYVRQQTGVDAFNRPEYLETEEIVEDVLVCPLSTDDVIGELQLSGKRAVYELCIPKTDRHDWTDTKVFFYGRMWRTFGFPQEWIGENVPLRWNRKVRVEAYG